jgi:hypothetical protein
MAITPSENASSRPGESGSSPTNRFLALARLMPVSKALFLPL